MLPCSVCVMELVVAIALALALTFQFKTVNDTTLPLPLPYTNTVNMRLPENKNSTVKKSELIFGGMEIHGPLV